MIIREIYYTKRFKRKKKFEICVKLLLCIVISLCKTSRRYSFFYLTTCTHSMHYTSDMTGVVSLILFLLLLLLLLLLLSIPQQNEFYDLHAADVKRYIHGILPHINNTFF